MDASLVSLIAQFGLPIVLVLFFVRAGAEREKRMAERLDTVQDRQLRVIESNTEALGNIVNESKETRVLMRELTEQVGRLACAREGPPWDGKDRRRIGA